MLGAAPLCQSKSNTYTGQSGQAEMEADVTCSHHLLHLFKVSAWQFLQNPLTHGNAIDQNSELKSLNTSAYP